MPILIFTAFAHAPAFSAPVALDDYAQRAMIEGTLTPHRNPLNLYSLVDDANRASQLARGALPWWSSAELKVSFLRPIPSALVWLDHAAAGYESFLPHLHSFFWLSVAVLGSYELLGSLFGARAGLAGGAVFALSTAHTVPILWLANRNALVTVAFGVFALNAQLRWRKSLSARDGAICCLLWALTMLTGEYALCFAGYVLSAELLQRGDSLRRRALGVGAYAAPLLAYLVIHAALGFGVRGSGFYRDPFGQFRAIVETGPREFATLLGSLWLGLDESWSSGMATGSLAAVLLALFAALGFTFWCVAPKLVSREKSNIFWLLLGSLLALLPVLPAQATTRVLGVAAIGWSGFVGVVLAAPWSNEAQPAKHDQPNGTSPAIAAMGFVIACGLAYGSFIRAPMSVRELSSLAADQEAAFERRFDWLRARREASETTLIVLRGLTPPSALWAPFMFHGAAPERYRVLTETPARLTVARVAPKAVVISPADGGPLLNFGTKDPVRDRGMQAGQTVAIPGLVVTVLAVNDEQEPLAIRFDFDHDLNAPSFRWVIEGASGFREARIPSVGQQLNVSL